MNAAERETVVVYSDADEDVRIFSCIRRDITAFRKNSAFTLVAEGKYTDGTVWAEFSVPVRDLRITARRRVHLSDEERAQRANRMRRLRGDAR